MTSLRLLNVTGNEEQKQEEQLGDYCNNPRKNW